MSISRVTGVIVLVLVRTFYVLLFLLAALMVVAGTAVEYMDVFLSLLIPAAVLFCCDRFFKWRLR